MGPKDNPFGGGTGSAREPAPESRTEGDVFELPGLSGGDPAQAAGVMGTMMELLQEKGGLGGLLATFRASGLGAQADSWASPGPNEPVSGDQMEQALGSPIVAMIAEKLGLSPEQAKATLAQVVPAVTSRMAAEERLTGEPQDALAKALGMLKAITG